MRLQAEIFASVIALVLLMNVCIGQEGPSEIPNVTSNSREGKLFPIFQIVQFPNTACQGASSRNGTCYTLAECTTRGGSGSGTCAAGFGVCCIFSLACGSTSSENCTYLTQTSTTANTISPCTYTICPCDSNVCRIRFDFDSFQIAEQTVGTAVLVGVPAVQNNADAIGECALDQFTLTAPGNFAPPVICGFNTGQHMIVDASDECHIARFALNGGATRAWDIKVTQYKCGDIGRGGDDGCLQYFTGQSGTIASYGFPTTTNPLPVTTTHLQDQCYSMCWRVEEGQCGICFTPVIEGTPGMVTASFGVGNPTKGQAKGERDNRCGLDYLLIPEAQGISAAAIDTFVVTTEIATDVELSNRICGRYFSSNAAGAMRVTPATICTQSRPFRVSFKTDDSEVTVDTMKANMNEQSALPGGIVGFYLNWQQQACA